MIVKRNIIQEERLFSVLKQFNGESRGMFADIIKILVMGDRCPGDINHWLDFSSGKFNSLISIAQVNNVGVCGTFVGFIRPECIKDSRFTLIRKEIKQKTPEEYFKYLWKSVYDQDVKGDPKYQHLMGSKPDSYVLDQLWYVLCNFTGQANEHSEPWKYSCNNPLLDLSQKIKLKEEQFKEKLKSIIFNLRPDIESAYEEHHKKK